MSKAALKDIKITIDAKNYEAAADKAATLTKQDKQNYTAYVFLGFAREKLDEDEAAQAAYEVATTIKPKDVQAVKGLITLHEKRGAAFLDNYHNAAERLAGLYADLDDKDQCQTVVDKYELFAKKHGSRAQYRHALELMLPNSSLYDYLEGRIPQPSHTLKRILESAEAEEKEWINTQIGERRTRLGARIEQVTQEVDVEATEKFQIEGILHALISWTHDDEARRRYEEQLLRKAFAKLKVLPPTVKHVQRDLVLDLANGMVIVKNPYKMAWDITLDWVDADDISNWDANIFHEYIQFFPDEGLSKVLKAYLQVLPDSRRPSATPSDTSGTSGASVMSEAERLILMVEGIEDCPESLLAHRIMAKTYLDIEEYNSAVDTGRKAQKLYLEAAEKYGLSLQNSIDAVNITLAKGLSSYQAPRYHPEARRIFDGILARKPTSIPALLGVGLILQEDEDYLGAVQFLDKALQRDAPNLRIRLELAWCRTLSGDLKFGISEFQELLQIVNAEKSINSTIKSEVIYRIGYCKWHLDTSKTARKDRDGAYKYLLESIKLNPSYAPAYTLLGIYFEDYGKSRKRARTAYQKAFELSLSELEAAQRLARTFADNGEWDLVELVAQRVVDSGKSRPAPGSKKRPYSWPYAALGVVEMNKQLYAKSIVSFQAALRISPADYNCWVGLGESYHNSGRYVAATRAFNKAESLDHGLSADQAWFTKYMLANVQREMGSYDEAINGYEDVLKINSNEFGVKIALLQTLAESAWAKIDVGMFGYASDLAKRAIIAARDTAEHHTEAFNMWKAVGDACSALAAVKVFTATFDTGDLSALLQKDCPAGTFDLLSDVDRVNIDALTTTTDGNASVAAHTGDSSDQCLIAAILSHKRAINLASRDLHARAVSWYNLGLAEYRAHVSGSSQLSNAKKSNRFLKAAMRCFKKAIEAEAGNPDFWNALGVVTTMLNVKVSQHSFIRSLHLNDHSAKAWTNLGALYLLNNDQELANEAFTRAQSIDPDYAHAWLGQGLIATMYGNVKEAQGLFAHAFSIASSASVPTKRQYAMSSFDRIINNPAIASEISPLVQSLFALYQLQSQRPFEIVYSHLLSMLVERLHGSNESASQLVDVCETLEGEYESTEATQTLLHFAQAKSDLARANLARNDFDIAIEDATTAIDLSTEGLESFPAESTALRLSAHLTAGLAHHHLGNLNDSILMIEAALKDSNHNPDVLVMLAQVLWAKGDDEHKTAAREQLLSCIESYPGHVATASLLGVIALVDNDDDALEAVKDDLEALRLSDKLIPLDRSKIQKVLQAITSSVSCSSDLGLLEAQNSTMLAPSQSSSWSALAVASSGNAYSAQMAVCTAQKEVPPGGNLDAAGLGAAYAATGRRKDALLAIVTAPWRSSGWESLAETVAEA